MKIAPSNIITIRYHANRT